MLVAWCYAADFIGRLGTIPPMIFILLIAIVASFFSPILLAAQSAEEYFEQGRKYHVGEGVEQDIDKALHFYQQALKRNGDLYAALYNAGLIYHAQEDYTRAHSLFLKAAKVANGLEQDADRYGAMARNGLGSSYQQLGKVVQAEKQFSIAKRMHPSFVEAHYNHINVLIQQQHYKEARKAMAVAVQLAPSNRYEKLKSHLKVEEQREQGGGLGGVTGIIAIVVLLLLYSLYLRRRAEQKR